MNDFDYEGGYLQEHNISYKSVILSLCFFPTFCTVNMLLSFQIVQTKIFGELKIRWTQSKEDERDSAERRGLNDN